MELSRSIVETKASEYAEVEPLYTVEAEQIELFADTVSGGQFGWRDVEWIVQWYFRRYLGAYPDAERRSTEAAFRENDFDAVVETLTAVVETAAPTAQVDTDTEAMLDRLTSLSGVDVPIASAFLQFLFPDRYVVVDERLWGELESIGAIDRSYPDPPSVEAYRLFQSACAELADRFGVDGWTVYRALWRLSTERSIDAST
ncbi:MAG: hypothetical protein ACQETB_12660 [Halobacteriota archaeon]